MNNTITIDPNSISTQDLHQLLLTSIAPRPIAFASTVDLEGNVNLSPFSFFNVFSANPPILVFSPARRSSNNTTKHSLDNVKEVKEVCINIVNFEIVEQMSLSSTEYDKGVNEFIKSGLTPIASQKIVPPRVKESPVSFECLVDQIIALGTKGGAGNLVICRVVNIHLDKTYLGTDGQLDTLKLDLVARLGKNWYARMTMDALFEIEKPIFSKGIGVDNLPMHAQKSLLLTGNELGRLANCERLPNKEMISKVLIYHQLKGVLELNNSKEKERKVHILAKKLLENKKTEEALAVLCSIE